MGQFLGFIVFDDLFQTFFSSDENDMVVDTIFDQLFEINQDVCAEDEFSVGGELRFGSLNQSLR